MLIQKGGIFDGGNMADSSEYAYYTQDIRIVQVRPASTTVGARVMDRFQVVPSLGASAMVPRRIMPEDWRARVGVPVTATGAVMATVLSPGGGVQVRPVMAERPSVLPIPFGAGPDGLGCFGYLGCGGR